MKLIPMTDFVLEQHVESSNQNEFEDNCYKYANFLKQPLKLEMFIPCDEDGNVLKKTVCINQCESCDCMYEFDLFEQSKEKVLFEGFSLRLDEDLKVLLLDETYCFRTFFNFNDAFRNKNIEDLVNRNLTLTPNAIKHIFS